MNTTLNVTVDVASEDLPLLKHELVEIPGVLTVLDPAPANIDELLSQAKDAFAFDATEGRISTDDALTSVRQILSENLYAGDLADPLVAKIQQLLDEDPTGVIRDTLWDLVENS
jgi:hypothetical protein